MDKDALLSYLPKLGLFECLEGLKEASVGLCKKSKMFLVKLHPFAYFWLLLKVSK